MSRSCVVFWVLTVVGLAQANPESPPADDPMQALSFLEGEWHGEGKSPYGPYEFEVKNERRGRWLLATSNIFVPGTHQVTVTATGLIGYDEAGLIAYAFDNAGVTIFRGALLDGGVRFEWKEGNSYRRRTMRRLDDGTISNREESFLPERSKDPLVFESVSKPGGRRLK
jgi:hypothetical protein